MVENLEIVRFLNCFVILFTYQLRVHITTLLPNLVMCFHGGNFWAISPKRCYVGEGYGVLDWLGALKGAIPKKEITIFKL
jgi:hypothetical protein